MQLEPAAPTEELGTRPVVVFLGERVLGQMRCARQRRRAAGANLIRQTRADDGGQHFAEHAKCTGGRGLRAAIAQHHIELGLVEIVHAVVGRDSDVEVGVGALKRFHARDQPQRRERREGAHADDAAAARPANLPHARIEPVEPRHHRAQQRAAIERQLDTARAACKQRRAKLLLEPFDLPTDRRLRHVQLVSRLAEIQAPRDCLKGPQAAQRQRPLAYEIHINSASTSALEFIGLSSRWRRS